MHSNEVEARDHCARPVTLDWKTHVIKGLRESDPPLVIRPKARADYRGAEVAQVQACWRVGCEGRRRGHLWDLQTSCDGAFPDQVARLVVARVAKGHRFCQVSSEAGPPVLHAEEV